jgi:hypothetical protein
MGRFFVIGDSFASPQDYSKGYDINLHFWPYIIKNQFNVEVFLNGHSSRDVQTIIDMWILSLEHLKDDDYLVIIIPYFIRTRLPLHESDWFKGFDVSMYTDDRDVPICRYLGTENYANNLELEFWCKNYDMEYFKKKLSTQSFINSTKAAQITYIKIIESLIKLSPKNTYVFSWEKMDYKSPFIDDKEDLKTKLGIWQSLNDDWISSNGEYGKVSDGHWGFNMNRKFAEFISYRFDLKKII